ncbi:MAG TPA: thioredoxin domain-containing protein [Alphaproteobacteria bacterium]|mgnify:CR=1 FL=1|nr:thioredoxin domain-containing protein [Alphaproteobacteria bacterium]
MPKSWFLRLLFAAIAVVAVMLVWRVWALSHAYSGVADVPPGMIAGPEHADLTVTMLFDYQCPYCHKAYPILLDAAKRDGRVRIALRPIAANGVDIVPRMAVAANLQGKFLDFHDALMLVEPPLNEDVCREASNKLGLNWTKMQFEAKSQTTKAFLDQGLDLAVKLGINSTPTFILGQIVYTPQGSMPTATDFLRLFDEARRGSAAPALPSAPASQTQ